MTKQEYLRALQEKLENFNRELQREITEDYEQHFAEGLAAGKTEEEIVEELGDIEDMIRELSEEDMRQETQLPEPVSRCSDSYQGEYKAIEIEGLIADVTLERSETGGIHVDYTNDGDAYAKRRYRFYQYEKDGVFYTGVKEEADIERGKWKKEKKVMLFGQTILSFNNMSWSNADIRLSVKIPDGMPRIGLRTQSGEVVINRVKGDQMTVETASGDVKLIQSSAQQIRMKTASGDTQVSDIACTEFELRMASGDIIADRVIAEALSIQTGSGDMEMRNIKTNRLTASAGSGDIVAKGQIGECSVKTGSGDVDIALDGDVRLVRVTTGSGDASLDMRKVSDVEVSMRTVSGDGVISGNGTRHRVSGGSYTVGSGACKVIVNTVSGDAEVRCR